MGVKFHNLNSSEFRDFNSNACLWPVGYAIQNFEYDGIDKNV